MTNQRAQFADQWRRWAVTALVIATLAAALSAPVRGGAAPKAPPVTLNTEIQHWGFYPSFSPDGKTIACISALFQINLWDSRSAALREILAAPDCNTIIQTIAWSPDAKWLAGGDWEGTIRVWDAQTGAVLRVLPASDDMILSLQFSADGRLLASGATDGRVQLWDPRTGALHKTLREAPPSDPTLQCNLVHSVAFSADGAVLASSGDDEVIRLWEVSTGKLLKRLGKPVHPNLQETSLAFAPTGRMLAAATVTSGLQLWNTTTGKRLQMLDGPDEQLYSVTYSPDGKRLAVGWADGRTALFDATSGKQQRRFTGVGHHGSFSPDGKRLALSNFHEAKVVHVDTGRLAASFTLPERHKKNQLTREWIAYTPDGFYVGALGDDPLWTVRWKVGEQNFSLEERTQFHQPERVAASLQDSGGEK